MDWVGQNRIHEDRRLLSQWLKIRDSVISERAISNPGDNDHGVSGEDRSVKKASTNIPLLSAKHEGKSEGKFKERSNRSKWVDL